MIVETRQQIIEKIKKDFILGGKTEKEILDSLRVGTTEYDFKSSVKIIKKGGQGKIFEIKSNIDGKTYAGKRLQYQIGSAFNDTDI